MGLYTFLQPILLSVLIKGLSAVYHAPTFIQQSNISVPASAGDFDPCRFFQIRNSALYRMGQSNIISSWNLSTSAYTQQKIYQNINWDSVVSNLAIGYQSDQIMATLVYPNNLLTFVPLKQFDILNPFTLSKTQTYSLSTTYTYTTSKVISTRTQYLQFIFSHFVNNYFSIYDKSMVLLQQILLPFVGQMNSTISEDQSSVIIWSYEGKVLFYQKQASSWIQAGNFSPTVSNSALNGVSMSKNGSFVILQYDSFSNFSIVNFRTHSTVSKTFTNTIINQAIFLDEDCHLVALTVNYTTVQIYDTLTLTLQSTTLFGTVSNYSVVDYPSGTLYLCLPQNIQVFKIVCPTLAYRNIVTNQCIDCIVSSNCNGCDKDTGICNSCYQNFTLNSSNFQCQPDYVQISILNTTNQTNSSSPINSTNSINGTNSTNNNVTNSTNNNITNSSIIYPNQQTQIKTISSTQALIANATINSFNTVSPVITAVFSIIQISPFALIFISFMNYWNLCCLYSILKVNVPGYLPLIHQKIFQSIQTSIFENIGFRPKLPSLNDQKVSSSYYTIDYNISLDFINPNLQNVLMIIFVFVLMLAILGIRNYFLKKSSFFYNLLKFSIVQSLIGQFISFVPFCILPYCFLINETGLLNSSQKFNLILQILLLILCFLAPCIFIWSRSLTYMESQVKRNKLFKEISKDSNKSKNLMQKVKSKDAKTQNQNFKELQMFIINISVPFLIILPLYLPFLIVNLVIFLYGIKIALKSSNYRINSIITACYLPLYHTCYIIFFLFGQNEFVCHYVGLFCLVVLFLGGIHELLNVVLISVFQKLKWLIKTSKQHCLSSKISNQPQASQISKVKLVSFNPHQQSLNFQKCSKINKITNIYKKGGDLKAITIRWNHKTEQLSDQIIQNDEIRKRAKCIKVKKQRTYQRGMDIKQTIKPVKKSFKKPEDMVDETQNFQILRMISKKQKNTNKKVKIFQGTPQCNQIVEHTKEDNDRFNQILKMDYLIRKKKLGINLPNYKIL